MTWVITRLCRDCLDMSCVAVCPVNCIYRYTGSDPKFPNQLFIDPQECIDCGACEPECPWEAIFKDDAVPAIFAEDIEINAWIVGVERDVPERPPDQKTPTPDEVKANKAKWGYS
jgi:ferredoxin